MWRIPLNTEAITPPSDSLGSSDDPQQLKGGRVGSVILWSSNGA